MRTFLFFFAVAMAATPAEYAVLNTGARLRVDHHEADGSKVRLHSQGGWTELDSSFVVRFEPDDPVPPAPKTAAAQPPATTAKTADPAALVDAIAAKYSLPKEFLHSVVKAESNYVPHAVSPKGAVGLMQLMPSTAKAYGADPHDPAQNVDAGARYLSELLLKYNYGVYHALAAYNAGPGAVEKYGGVPPYRETREYIRRIISSWTKKQQ